MYKPNKYPLWIPDGTILTPEEDSFLNNIKKLEEHSCYYTFRCALSILTDKVDIECLLSEKRSKTPKFRVGTISEAHFDGKKPFEKCTCKQPYELSDLQEFIIHQTIGAVVGMGYAHFDKHKTVEGFAENLKGGNAQTHLDQGRRFLVDNNKAMRMEIDFVLQEWSSHKDSVHYNIINVVPSIYMIKREDFLQEFDPDDSLFKDDEEKSK